MSQIDKQGLNEETKKEILRIMGDRYYVGVGADFTAENIIDIISNLEAKVREEQNSLIYKHIQSFRDCEAKRDYILDRLEFITRPALSKKEL